MTIKKYVGNTREEALEAARSDLGDTMVVMNVKTIRGTGLRRLLARTTYEVTAAVEDDAPAPSYTDVAGLATENRLPQPPARRFEAVADADTTDEATGRATTAGQPRREERSLSDNEQESLRDAFKAVSEVMEQANAKDNKSIATMPTYDRNATLIKYNDPAKSTDYTSGTGARPRTGAGRTAQGNRAPEGTGRLPNLPVDRQGTGRLPNVPADMQGTGRLPTVPADLQGTGRLPRLSTANPSRMTEGSPAAREAVELAPEALREGEARADTSNSIIKAIYAMLLEQEVDERYINQVLADIDLSGAHLSNVETALGLVYQKLVLKFGRPAPVTVGEVRPQVVFLVGPTGVGKTTTIAKLASEFKLTQGRKVAIFTADTYRIAAERQLSTYAEIMSIPLEILYEGDDINEYIGKYHRYDLILIDTTGFSHKSDEQRDNLEALLTSVDEKYRKRVFLVLSATTKYRDLKEISDVYASFTPFDLIFTKLDETNAFGNILNMRLYTGAPLSYVTTGQNVPSDIEVIDSQKMTNNLLGGDG